MNNGGDRVPIRVGQKVGAVGEALGPDIPVRLHQQLHSRTRCGLKLHRQGTGAWRDENDEPVITVDDGAIQQSVHHHAWRQVHVNRVSVREQRRGCCSSSTTTEKKRGEQNPLNAAKPSSGEFSGQHTDYQAHGPTPLRNGESGNHLSDSFDLTYLADKPLGRVLERSSEAGWYSLVH